jgi:hypothetical protein
MDNWEELTKFSDLELLRLLVNIAPTSLKGEWIKLDIQRRLLIA